MSNAKRRHRRRWRARAADANAWRRAGEEIEHLKRRGLWGFDQCRTIRGDDGKVLVHILRGGFGYF